MTTHPPPRRGEQLALALIAASSGLVAFVLFVAVFWIGRATA